LSGEIPLKQPTGREVLAGHIAYPNARTAAAALGITEEELSQRIVRGQPGYVLLLGLYRDYVEPAKLIRAGRDYVDDDDNDDQEPATPPPPYYGQRLRLHRTG
jgi:hypothetical protein